MPITKKPIYIHEPTPLQCGQAVLAMLANVSVEEIIDLVLFLASDKAKFINGENIMIDGGRNAMQRGNY